MALWSRDLRYTVLKSRTSNLNIKLRKKLLRCNICAIFREFIINQSYLILIKCPNHLNVIFTLNKILI